MNLNNIYEGLIIKNYNELCELLEEPHKTGNARLAHFKQFDRYFSYKKYGHKIIIDSIYDEPIEEATRGLYSPLIQKLLVDYLCREYIDNERSEILITKNQLFEKLGFVKKEYKTYNNNQYELADMLGIEVNIINEFYSVTNSKISDYISSAINALANRSIIDFSQTYIVVDKDGEFSQARKPTTEEHILFLEADYNARVKLTPSNYRSNDSSVAFGNILPLKDIFMRGLWNSYESLVNIYVRDNGGDHINFFYKGYSLILTKNIVSVKNNLDKYILQNTKDIVDEINSIFVDSHKKSYDNLGEKAKKELQELNENMSYNKAVTIALRSQDNYVDDGKRLIDATMNKKINFNKMTIPKILKPNDSDEFIPF
jgi:hypothetical protein